MNQFNIEHAHEVGKYQIRAANAVVNADKFDHWNGELLLRNPAVFCDRLTHVQFSNLAPATQANFVAVARRSIAELSGVAQDRMTQRFPKESEEAHEYRVEVYSVLHGLQRVVAIGPDRESGYQSSKEGLLRELIVQSSEGFGAGIVEAVSDGHAQLTRDLRYFQGNIPKGVLQHQ